MENRAFISELIPIESKNDVLIEPQPGTGFFPKGKQNMFEVLDTDEFSYTPKKKVEEEEEGEEGEEGEEKGEEGEDVGEEATLEEREQERQKEDLEKEVMEDLNEEKSEHMVSYLKSRAIPSIHYSEIGEEISEKEYKFPEYEEGEIIAEFEESVKSIKKPKKNKERIFEDSQDIFYRPKWEYQMENTLNAKERKAFISKNKLEPNEYQKMFEEPEEKIQQVNKKRCEGIN